MWNIFFRNTTFWFFKRNIIIITPSNVFHIFIVCIELHVDILYLSIQSLSLIDANCVRSCISFLIYEKVRLFFVFTILRRYDYSQWVTPFFCLSIVYFVQLNFHFYIEMHRATLDLLFVNLLLSCIFI
jgi:hypothetical protein